MSFGKVEAGSGVNWLTEGIRIIMANPAAFLVMGLILAVINFIPILGGLVLTICGPALIGGIVYAAREQAEGCKAEIAHLFRAFQEPGKIGPMLLLCLPAIVGGAVLLICGLRVRHRRADRRRSFGGQQQLDVRAGRRARRRRLRAAADRDRADVPDLRAAVLRGAAGHARWRRTLCGDEGKPERLPCQLRRVPRVRRSCCSSRSSCSRSR